MKVYVCIPTHGEWKSTFGISLATMAFHTAQNPPSGLTSVCWSCIEHSVLPASRDDLAKEAIAAGAEYLLWLDCDMGFPRDTLERLLAHQKDIVGANCVRRVPPYSPTATGLDGNLVYTEEGQEGLQEVSHTGLAVTLVRADLYRQLPRPWHFFGYDKEKERHTGEDINFIQSARALGAKCYIDHGLSQEIQHFGTSGFDFAWSRGFREGQEAARELTDGAESPRE